MREVGVLEAKTHFSSLLDEVERGEEVAITRHGRRIARLVAESGDSRAAKRSGAEIAESFRERRERIRAIWPDEPEFDWKAAIEDGRE